MPNHEYGGSTRAAITHLRSLLLLTAKPRWATPALITLGLGASLAETLGITLIILFFYSASGELENAAAVGGSFGRVLAFGAGVFGSSQQMAGVILVLIILRGAMSFANSVISARVSEMISERTRNLIHQQYLTVSYRFIQQHDQAQLMEVLGTESWLVAGAYGSLTKIMISSCSVLVFSTVLLALSWKITVTAIMGVAVMSLGLRRLRGPAQRLGARVKQVHQRLGEQMLMTLEGLRTIRAYGQEHQHQQRFVGSSANAREASLAMARLSALLNPLTEVGYLGILCIIIAGTDIWRSSFATTLAAVALLYRLQPYTRDIEVHLLYLAQIEAPLRSALAMLRRDDKEYLTSGAHRFTSVRKSIRFDHVTFCYESENKPALDDVSFEIPAGEMTALLGASGAGKTTVINLLLGLYRPTSGTIWIDDVRMDDIQRTDWLRHLAVAGQDVELVEGTVIDNIRMANPAASIESVIEASRTAGVAEFIESLDDGYETWIGQKGLRFSGGQRQRLGLARAVLRNPDFLMLDEATSALDQALERRVRGALETRFAGCTILVISHRVETLLNIEHRVHLEDGKVVPPSPHWVDSVARRDLSRNMDEPATPAAGGA